MDTDNNRKRSNSSKELWGSIFIHYKLWDLLGIEWSWVHIWEAYEHKLKSELRGIIGISAIAQWFQNLTSVSQVAVEVWIWFLVHQSVLKNPALLHLWLILIPWPRNCCGSLRCCLKKREELVVWYIFQLEIYLSITNKGSSGPPN